MKHMEIAFSQYGIKEIKGSEDNPEVLKYFDAMGFDGKKLKDETAWCAAFANYCTSMAFNTEYTGTLKARDWLSVGVPVSSPRFGDVVVLWRESKSSWKGHVGFFINQDKDHVYLLGGNQGNQVCIAPYDNYRILGYRRL